MSKLSDLGWSQLGPIGRMMAAFVSIWEWVFRPRSMAENQTLYDYSRVIEDEKWAENIIRIQKEQLRLYVERDKIREQMRPEIECMGCGYWHNRAKCPKCRRQVRSHATVSWVTSGSANISKTISGLPDYLGVRLGDVIDMGEYINHVPMSDNNLQSH